jgi:fatty acid desaturase
MVGNPFFGKLSDRTASRLGMRRPWMVIGLVGGSLGILVVALAPSIPVVLIGWCIAQLLFNALLAMFLAPCAIGGLFVLLFAVRLDDRRLAKEDKPAWSLRELASTFYVSLRKSPDFAWAFASRFMFVLA